MNPVQKKETAIAANVYNALVQQPLEIGAVIVKDTDLLVKVIKISKRVFECFQAAGTILSNAGKAVFAQFGHAIFWLDTFSYVSTLKDLLTKNEHGKYYLEAGHTWQKIASKVSLFVGLTLGMVQKGVTLGLYQLGAFGKYVIGNLPVVRFVTDFFVLGSVALGIWDSTETVIAKKKGADEALLKAGKWSTMAGHKENYDLNAFFVKLAEPNQLSEIEEDGHQEMSINADMLRDKYLDKIEEHKNNESKASLIAHWMKIIKKADAVLEEPKDVDAVTELGNILKEHEALKVKKWEVIGSNDMLERKKAIISLVISVIKVALIVIGAAIAIANFYVLPVTAILLALGFANDTFGISQTFYNKKNKKAELPAPFAHVHLAAAA